MFSTDALTWRFAIRHHLSRPESCEPERGFTCCMGKGWLQYHRWAARVVQKRCSLYLLFKICLKTVRRHSAVCNASPNHPLDTTARPAS